MVDALLERLGQGDRRALARLLSLIARGEQVGAIRQRLPQAQTQARVVAITGSGGVGKSTLVGALIETIRRQGLKVAVLACDPQSPLSGGALLGDRFRMPARADDDGVFIRSLAAATGHGAIAGDLETMIRVLEVFGFDVVLIETVGAGQGDTAVRALADVVVLLVQPEAGDDLQWEKAGLLEVADIVVIHKADLPGADQVEGQVRAMLGLTEGRSTAVLRVSGRTGQGLAELWQAIAACPRRRGTGDNDMDLLRLGQALLAERFSQAEASGNPALQQLRERWRRGQVPAPDAGAAILDLLRDKP